MQVRGCWSLADFTKPRKRVLPGGGAAPRIATVPLMTLPLKPGCCWLTTVPVAGSVGGGGGVGEADGVAPGFWVPEDLPRHPAKSAQAARAEAIRTSERVL